MCPNMQTDKKCVHDAADFSQEKKKKQGTNNTWCSLSIWGVVNDGKRRLELCCEKFIEKGQVGKVKSKSLS